MAIPEASGVHAGTGGFAPEKNALTRGGTASRRRDSGSFDRVNNTTPADSHRTLGDLISEALAALRAAGLPFKTLEPDTGFRRHPDREHARLWYIANAGVSARSGRPYLQVSAGDPRLTGGVEKASFTWSSWKDARGAELAGAELAEVRRAIEEKKREAKVALDQCRAKARSEASRTWSSAAKEGAGEHPYLLAKGVRAHGLRLNGRSLLIPVQDAGGELHALQSIAPNGDKRFTKDGDISGHFHLIGEPTPGESLYVVEGYATGATIHEATGAPAAIAFFCGNLRPVAEALRKAYPEARLVLAGDNDAWRPGNPGATRATEAGKAVGAAVVLPYFNGFDQADRPTDYNDLARLGGLAAVRAQLGFAPGAGDRGDSGDFPCESKRGPGATQGRPGATFAPLGGDSGPKTTKAETLGRLARALKHKTPEVVEYPVNALGPLAEAAVAVSVGAQLRPAMAGQSVLAVAALLAQERANVQGLDGTMPLSLYLLTLGESGEGKTTADRAAQGAVQDQQRKDTDAYLRELAAWEDAPKKGRGPPPREPYRVARDGTVEGIRRGFAMGCPSQCVFTSEAAAVLTGYGMTPEHRAKSAATFNGLWDDCEISVSRAIAGRIQLYDRRLSIHWMIQPDAAEAVLADQALSTMGFWPRFLVAWPEASEPRKYRRWRAEDHCGIKAFWARCKEMMRYADGAPPESCSRLEALEMTTQAESLMGEFFERMESQSKGPRPALGNIRPFALRAASQATRIAGVLTAFEGEPKVNDEAVRCGIGLTVYSLDTWQSIFGDRDRADAIKWAMMLGSWMMDQPNRTASETSILHIGPKALRSKIRRDTALAVLEQACCASRMGTTWTLEVD